MIATADSSYAEPSLAASRDGATRTTTRMLEDLHDEANAAAWETFDARHRPILFGVGRRLGLTSEDAADVAQQAMAEFVRDYRAGRYDRSRGRLRTWILSIARHRAYDLLRRRRVRREDRGASALDIMPDAAELEALWDIEQQRAMLAAAMSELREGTDTDLRTIEAFELVAIEGVPPGEVARACGMTVNEVYRVKHRVTRRLRAIVAERFDLYDQAPAA